jgi:hypothetical protein
MSFDDFIKLYTNIPCDFDGSYGTQCMDLAHFYKYIVLGIHDKTTLSAPTAAQVWGLNYPTLFDKIPNSPTNFPLRGDIIIWGTTIGSAGHIAICTKADKDNFESFDANWPVGSNPHLQAHTYNGVLGWFRFKGQLPSTENLDKIVAELSAVKSQLNLLQVKYNELQDKYALDMAEKQKHIESIQASSAEMTAQLQIGTETIKGLTEQIEGLKIDSSALKDQLADFMEGNDTLNETITKLTQTLNKRYLEVSELKAKLKEGLKAYTKFQLFLELFRK